MRRAATVVILAAVAVAVAGCGGSGPSKADCKKAMRQEYAVALASGRQGHEPAACKGLPASVLDRLAAEILSGN